MNHSPAPLTYRRGRDVHPDTTHDQGIFDATGRLIGEAYSRATPIVDGKPAVEDEPLDAIPAYENAKLWTASPVMAQALEKLLAMLEGTSGAGAAVWCEYPEYAAAVRALRAAGVVTDEWAESRLMLCDDDAEGDDHA